MAETMYGCIDEDELTFDSPRMLDGDEVKSVDKAMDQAIDMIRAGTQNVSICKAKFYGDDGNGYWGEIVDAGTIKIDAYNCEWIAEED